MILVTVKGLSDETNYTIRAIVVEKYGLSKRDNKQPNISFITTGCKKEGFVLKIILTALNVFLISFYYVESDNYGKVEFKAGHLRARRIKMDSDYCQLGRCKFEPKPVIITNKYYPLIDEFKEDDQEIIIPFEQPDRSTKFKITCTGENELKKVEFQYQSSRTDKMSIFQPTERLQKM
jgi:hypothetical protein